MASSEYPNFRYKGPQVRAHVHIWAPSKLSMAKGSTLNELLQLWPPNAWDPRWWGKDLFVSLPFIFILFVLGLGRVKIHHTAIQGLPCTLVRPRAFQKLPVQHLSKLDQVQAPQGRGTLCKGSNLEIMDDVGIVLSGSDGLGWKVCQVEHQLQ